MSETIDVGEALDTRRLGGYQKLIIFLCAVCMFTDGFDTAIIGYLAPTLSKLWSLKPGALGPVFGIGMVGMLLGSLAVGPIADRVGRKIPILVCLALFGVLTAVLPWYVSGLDSLFWVRFASGLALGGAYPTAISLVSEFAPGRLRPSVVMIMLIGFSIGSGGGGMICAALIAQFGWQATFLFGGLLPLVLVPALAVTLPESARFLAANGRDPSRIAATLHRIDRSMPIPQGARFIATAEGSSASVKELFTEGRALGTMMLGVMSFAAMWTVYVIMSWSTTLAVAAGIPQSTAIIAPGLINISGILAALGAAWLVTRVDRYRFMTVTWLLSVIAMWLVGLSVPVSGEALMAATFSAGFVIIASMQLLNASAAAHYPTKIRASGIGAIIGFGRLGAIIGPTLGGLAVGWGWPAPLFFQVAAIPAGIATVASLVMVIANGRTAAVPQKGPMFHEEAADIK